MLLCTRLTASKIFPQQYPKPCSSTVLWMIFPVHTYSPSWLLSFPSYCTIRMTASDLLHRGCILNNPERRWHSQLWMGPMQTPLSCWKDKLRSDWCGVFQRGMIKNKNLGEGRYFEEKLLYSQKQNYFEAALQTVRLCRNGGYGGKRLSRL